MKEELGVVCSEFGGMLANNVRNGLRAPDKSGLAVAPGLVAFEARPNIHGTLQYLQ